MAGGASVLVILVGEFFVLGFHDQRRGAVRATPAPKEAASCEIVCTLENIFYVTYIMWITQRKVGGFVAKPLFLGGFVAQLFDLMPPSSLKWRGKTLVFEWAPMMMINHLDARGEGCGAVEITKG